MISGGHWAREAAASNSDRETSLARACSVSWREGGRGGKGGSEGGSEAGEREGGRREGGRNHGRDREEQGGIEDKEGRGAGGQEGRRERRHVRQPWAQGGRLQAQREACSSPALS